MKGTGAQLSSPGEGRFNSIFMSVDNLAAFSGAVDNVPSDRRRSVDACGKLNSSLCRRHFCDLLKVSR